MNTTNMHHSVSDIAHAIAERYAHLQVGEKLSFSQGLGDLQQTAKLENLSTEMQGVLAGCRMLGFVEHDAQCIMQAWNKQSARLGAFDIALWPSQPGDFGVLP